MGHFSRDTARSRQVRLRAVLIGFLIDASSAEASIGVIAPRSLTEGLLWPPATRAVLPQIPGRRVTLKPLERTMKRLALLAFVGLAISFVLPTFAQQKDTITDPQIVDQLKAIGKKTGEAFAKNDATALAALYTEDAVLVPDTGPVYGREAIEKFWAGMFKKLHVINEVDTSDPYSPHRMGTAGAEAWSTGQWTLTFQGPNGSPVELTGHWTEIYRREGDTWRKRLDTFNQTPAPAAAPSPTATPTTMTAPVPAPENGTVDPESRQELEAVDTKLDQAIDKNDAAAAAALFTEDAILMLPLEFAPERSGIFSGRPAIEKWFTQKFTDYHVTDSKGKLDQIHAVDNGMWAVGTWMHTVDFRRTPGYRAIFFVPVGDSYQIRKMFVEF